MKGIRFLDSDEKMKKDSNAFESFQEERFFGGVDLVSVVFWVFLI